MTAALVDAAAPAALVPAPRQPATTPEYWRVVERAQAGDAEAFADIYRANVASVLTFVYWRVGKDRQLAQDIVSETFVRALSRIGSVTWQGRDILAWLTTIARNLIADHFKSGHHRLTITVGELQDEDRDESPEGNPEKAVVNHITNLDLLRAVQQLGAEQREVIVLRYLQGLSVAEAAQAMGKNEGAIKALTYRAVTALRKHMPKFVEVA